MERYGAWFSSQTQRALIWLVSVYVAGVKTFICFVERHYSMFRVGCAGGAGAHATDFREE